ncbi:MAG: N-acetylglucosamine-6-phosphate deacetylase [Candidatus Flemingiibacterium sp.]
MIRKFTDALIYSTDNRRFEPGELTVSDGRFSADAPDETVSLGGARVIPGMIDIHTHGHGGYESTEVDADGMTAMAKSYATVGTTSFMVTMMSVPLEQLEACIDAAAAAKAAPGKGCANILGVYLEGRYISLAKKGAHDPRYIAAPNPDELERLIERARPAGRFYTICAPDIPGTEELVKRAVKLGAIVSIGHSNATCAQCEECLGWGASCFTHLYNAMSGLNHRAPGCVGAALSGDSYVELICDGVHVAPEAVKLAYRAKAKDKLVLITDSAPAAGLPEGKYRMGGADVVVRDGAVFLEDGTLTGGSISLFEAMKNLTRFAGIPLEDAIPAATANPARLLGVYSEVGSLEVGKRADFIVLGADDSLRDVYVGGKKV